MADALNVDLRSLLGLGPLSPALTSLIESLSTCASVPTSVPQVKSYPDAVYFNYFTLGLSLLFSPQQGYKPKTGLKMEDLDLSKLLVDSVDVYNQPKVKRPGADPSQSSTRSQELAFASFPVPFSLVRLFSSSASEESESDKLYVTLETTGKDFVSFFKEPQKKGGGAGPASGSIGIWCEWSLDGVMVEFGGDEARGPQAWEKGKDAPWKVITIFSPQTSSKAS